MAHEEIFQTWLGSTSLNPQEREELQSLPEKDKIERFSNKPYVFGTSGIRALTGLGTQRLNRFTYRLIGTGCAIYFKRRHANPIILVVHDNRNEGQKYSLEVASTLKHLGVQVLLAPNSGALSTPILSHLIRKKGLCGGISITASHNPINYNGLKIFNDKGKQLNKEEESEFLEVLPNPQQAIYIDIDVLDQSSFKTIGIDEINDYLTLLSSIISSDPKPKNIPILFSSYRGTTMHIMEQFAHKLNFPLFKEFMQKNNDLMNPEDPASFQELVEQAQINNIQYVMCADLDGDRAAMAELQPNKTWYFFNGNEIGVMLANFKNITHHQNNSYIVSTHVTNTLINHLFPNIPIFLSNTGFKHIAEIVEKEEQKNQNLLIAFEEACGALMNPIHREKDSYQQIGYALELINYLKIQNKTLWDYLEELRRTSIGYWMGWTNHYQVSPDEEKIQKLKKENIAQKILENFPIPFIKVNYSQDIVTWELKNQSWIKFRYSGTEPKLKIYYNLFHKNKEELKWWCQIVKDRFDTLINQIKEI